MNRERLGGVLVVCLLIVGLGVVGASVFDPTGDEGPPSEPAERPGGPNGEGAPAPDGELVPCPAVLTWPRSLLLGAGLFAAVGGLAFHLSRSALVAVPVGGVPLLPLFTICPPSGLPAGLRLPGVGLSRPLLAAALLVAIAGAAALVYVNSGTVGRRPETLSEPDGTDLAEIGSIAGDAAERIERQAAVDNAVYRAWREMTDHLDVERPAATSPAEFADAAVAAGMARADVRALTALFEEVRYGGRDPSLRADAALRALRRIEETYGEDGSEGGASAENDDDADGAVDRTDDRTTDRADDRDGAPTDGSGDDRWGGGGE